MSSLKELDSIEILVLVNNEIDYISPSANPAVKQTNMLTGVRWKSLAPDQKRGEASSEVQMESLCCGAHGLSLMVTATSGDVRHTMLFDAGPEEDVFERNATRLGFDAAAIEHIHLSHWHRDHSGGMLRAIQMINDSKRARGQEASVAVGLHPDRPDYRGINARGTIISLEKDPSFDEIERAGGAVMKSNAPHTILDDMFLVSGEVPRQTDYEEGFRAGVRFTEATGQWEKDELIMDERFVMCKLKGKGLVVFAGCSHPGVVNICQNAAQLGEESPIHAVVGGFHLADGDPIKMQKSMDDLKKLKPTILMPGHCTGWRFNFKIEQEMPGSFVPCFGGIKYTLE